MTVDVVGKQIARHGGFISDHVQTTARSERREDRRVPQVCSQRGYGGKVQWRSVGFQLSAYELGVIHQIGVADSNALGKAGGS